MNILNNLNIKIIQTQRFIFPLDRSEQCSSYLEYIRLRE
jgi:hypothetical protein